MEKVKKPLRRKKVKNLNLWCQSEHGIELMKIPVEFSLVSKKVKKKVCYLRYRRFPFTGTDKAVGCRKIH